MESDREKFIDEHKALFWYTPDADKRGVSDELLVETILNDGTLDGFRELKRILTPRRLAHVFFSATGRKAGNYYPEIRNFFSLAAMKAYALGRRSKWKDYVDLYFLLTRHFSLNEVVEKAVGIFGDLFSEKLFRAQLSYYADVDYRMQRRVAKG